MVKFCANVLFVYVLFNKEPNQQTCIINKVALDNNFVYGLQLKNWNILFGDISVGRNTLQTRILRF